MAFSPFVAVVPAACGAFNRSYSSTVAVRLSPAMDRLGQKMTTCSEPRLPAIFTKCAFWLIGANAQRKPDANGLAERQVVPVQ
jgi:hypothetical protein